jgi:hypothetical protein
LLHPCPLVKLSPEQVLGLIMKDNISPFFQRPLNPFTTTKKGYQNWLKISDVPPKKYKKILHNGILYKNSQFAQNLHLTILMLSHLWHLMNHEVEY